MNEEQKALARHALGLDGKRKMSYRNRFVTGPGSGDYETWIDMVAAGHANRREGASLPYGGDDLFWLTLAGARAALRPDEKLDPEDFPEKEEP